MKLEKRGASLEEILDFINDWLENVRILFVPLNLKFVKKSGRVSAAAAFVGDALGLKPIITFEDGESKIVTKIRGDKKAMAEIIDITMKERKANTPYALVYGSNLEAYDRFKEMIDEKLDIPPYIEYAVGAVISLNAGPEVVAIIFHK